MNKFSFGPSLSTEVAAASSLTKAIDNAQTTVTASADSPIVAGFGAGVHQYLNQLLALVYSKTTTLLAANMVLISLLLSTRTSIKIALNSFYIGAIFFFALSAILSTIVLFPRLRHDTSGSHLLERHSRRQRSNDLYARVQNLAQASVEEEYVRDNYHLARVIQLKDTLLRGAIVAFICGLICAVIGVVLPMLLASY